MMKNYLKKTLSVLLASAMVLSMAACGGGEEKQATGEAEEKKEFVWVPEFIKLDNEASFYNAKEQDGYLYYEKYDWDEETMKSSYSIESISLTDGKAGISLPISIQLEEEENADEKTEGGMMGSSRNVSAFRPVEDGIFTVESIYHWNEETGENSSEHFICKYDMTGEKVMETDITEILSKDENNSWVSNLDLDGQGRMYLAADTAVILLDAEGNFHGTVKLGADNWISGMGCGKDGKVFLSFYNRNGFGMTLQEVNFEEKALGATYEGFLSGNSSNALLHGLTKDFMVNNNGSLYEYDLQTQTNEEILNWLDSDIDANYVEGAYALSDGKIACITNDWESNTTELAILTKKPAAEVKQKTEIVIGSLYADPSIQSSAVKFNKSNDSYRIRLKSYYDYNAVESNGDEGNYDEIMADALNRMNNDIISDNCPDMLVLSGIDVKRYAAKGVFEDLTPWMDGSSKVKREDYFENILDAYTYDGVLVSVPKSFELRTLVGKASDLGKEPGWTVEEMLAYGKENPDADLLYGLTRAYALDLMLQFNQGNYVDWSTGKCDFENDSFISLLEFAAQFPEKYEYDDTAPSEPTLIGRGELLLHQMYIYDFQSVQMAEAMFGDDACFIGFPNEDGVSGTYLQASTGLAMTSKSDCKEGAWAFLEAYLSEESDRYSFGFSSKKDFFNEAKEEATKVEYLKDEKGELVLDENGEPIAMNAGGSVGYGDDWMYTYHVPTKEEVAQLEQLISVARPGGTADATVLGIIKEEAGAFFSGQRSAADVAGVIQSRVQVYVNENR